MKIEQKYVFIEQQGAIVHEWLEHACVRDSLHYQGTVSSIYFDTLRLDHYYEKRNSDYIKAKVRLRWYENVDDNEEPFEVPCYVETKSKRGVGRYKQRKRIFISSSRLRNNPFDDDEVLAVPGLLFDLDYVQRGLLVPTLLIQYDRRRYVDPGTGSRIAVDTNIRCARANLSYVRGLPPVHLATGVLEVKGEGRELPSSLTPIRGYLTVEAFSKYARCYEHLVQPLGRRQ